MVIALIALFLVILALNGISIAELGGILLLGVLGLLAMVGIIDHRRLHHTHKPA